MLTRFITKHITFENWAKLNFAGVVIGGGVGGGYGVGLAAFNPKLKNLKYPHNNIVREMGLLIRKPRSDRSACIEYPMVGMMFGALVGLGVVSVGPVAVPVCGITYGLQKLVQSETFTRNQ